VPSIYAGDEQGFTGVKEHREHGDDAVRPEFPADPAELSTLGAPVLAVFQELIALRRRHPWLVHATTSVEHLDNRQFVYRSTSEDGSLLVALNLDDAELVRPLPAGEWDVAAGRIECRDGKLTVGGHGWGVLAGR
jgi:cyclomaltodextrinase